MTTGEESDTATAKDLDLVLFGATGFTGRLVAEYLVKKRPSLRWALAGRSRSKLEAVRAELAAIDAAARELPLIVGDSLDPAAVLAMVRRARVVCTTVGPYARYGRALVAACAESGVHYCDLTGETPFIRDSIDAHHDRAAATGARVVHCCGFDSIPSDLGVLVLHEHFQQRQKRLAEAHFRVLKAKGGASGGTIASALGIMEEARDPAIRRVLSDPYALNPKGERSGPDGADQTMPERDPDTGHWTAPFLMAAVNTRIVRRSNALLGYPYGRDFRYDEATELSAGPAGMLGAAAMSAGFGASALVMAIPATRRLVARLLPKPGEGPSKEARESGFFHVAIHGVSSDGERATVLVAGTSDPGYGETAKMLGEAALCLAEDPLSSKGGVLTPASAMGMLLVKRLQAAGMTFHPQGPQGGGQ